MGGPALHFGKTSVLSSSRDEKLAWRGAESEPFESAWVDETMRLTFTPEVAGFIDVSLWYGAEHEGATASTSPA